MGDFAALLAMAARVEAAGNRCYCCHVCPSLEEYEAGAECVHAAWCADIPHIANAVRALVGVVDPVALAFRLGRYDREWALLAVGGRNHDQITKALAALNAAVGGE